ncbi:AbrB/MazE/SpoVT family DNA-binding domain-containing protein [Candidatus Parcubacteria bacterium]|nr:AbrB/MazE/SpoVT family DNA-binding domain-containing protein [Candidatus Parcubacteria bacterium]
MENNLQLIKITKNFQVTLPSKLRNILKLKEGDYLEAKIKNGVFIFKPKKLVDIDPDQ